MMVDMNNRPYYRAQESDFDDENYDYIQTPSYEEYTEALNQWRRKSEDRTASNRWGN